MKLFLWVMWAIILSIPFIGDCRMIIPPLSDNIAAPIIKQEEKPIVPEAKPKTVPSSVPELIRHYSKQYWVSEKLAMAIATCESWLNPNAKNKNSTAGGVFQFLDGTFKSSWKKYWIAWNKFDAATNIELAMAKISNEWPAAWNASKNCWKKKLV